MIYRPNSLRIQYARTFVTFHYHLQLVVPLPLAIRLKNLSMREEWATECERLASACEEWESKVKNVKTNVCSAAAKFDAELARFKVLQRQHQ